jgi:DNA-binding response OmpR family regulator
MALAVAPRPSGRWRILVVDDDPASRAAVARLLAEEGYDAAVAADGEEATGLVSSWHPDLVVTDLEMPRLDGRGLIERVRRLQPGTPVLVLSARCDPRAAVGSDGFFPKPIQVESLLARIRALVGHEPPISVARRTPRS